MYYTSVLLIKTSFKSILCMLLFSVMLYMDHITNLL